MGTSITLGASVIINNNAPKASTAPGANITIGANTPTFLIKIESRLIIVLFFMSYISRIQIILRLFLQVCLLFLFLL